ncbi:hypothetical protein [Halohasta litchfieldiae]|uniref:hypothetical protein n=1 Tax=Halohasta litchfieldiae TaxID=1073996 RepID=UPI0013A55599|nr:hypothetical protein [Halohasta litchfieldiae]
MVVDSQWLSPPTFRWDVRISRASAVDASPFGGAGSSGVIGGWLPTVDAFG